MANQLKDYDVYVETSSLLDRRASVFWGRILPKYLIENNARITVPYCVIKKLKKAKKGTGPTVSDTAEKVLVILEYLWENGLAHVPEENRDEPPDQYFLNRFSQFRATKNLCLITNDGTLAQKIIHLKKTMPRNTGNDLKVLYVKDNLTGGIEHFLGDWENNGNQTIPTPHQNTRAFTLPTVPIAIKNTPLPVSSIPASGSEVLTRNNGRVRVLKAIAGGGEGTVYKANSGAVCKIYKKEQVTEEKLKKLELMVSNPVIYPGICWPKDLLYNTRGEFVGYLMDKAQGSTIHSCLFGIREITNHFPFWRRENLVNCSVEVLKRMVVLHQLNVILGDINPFNIMVKGENEVYLVDTDSYQIEGYPCPVGTTDFTAPELQGKVFDRFLRTFDHEKFAVATLIFKLLFYGKPPYAKIGGGTAEDNIRQMGFPYPFGQTDGSKVPLGPFLDIWINLPFRIRDAFYDVFKNNERKSASEWLGLMRDYRDSLNKGLVSNELVPRGFNHQNRKKVACSSCNRSFYEGEGYLIRTMPNAMHMVCPACGQNLKRTNNQHSKVSQGSGLKNRPPVHRGKGSLLNQFFQP